MGLFHKNPSEANFAGGSKNVMESIQREHDTGTLIYLDPRSDFNTNSVITVAPNEQAIFIKNGEIYGVLPPGRHEVKTENYPILSRIRNMLSGGISTFTCQVYHVSTSEQNIGWGTASAIEIQDFFLGGGIIGVPTLIRGSGEFRVCFNIREDDSAASTLFLRLMGDKSIYTVDDLAMLFRAQLSQKSRSKRESINAISSQLEDFATELTPSFKEVFTEYGLELVNFSFHNLTIEETEVRQKYLDRLIGSVHAGGYNIAVQQELAKDAVNNPGAGGLAGAGAGLGMGLAAGGAFASMGASVFAQQQQQQPMGFAGQQPNPMQQQMQMQQQQMQQQAAAPQADPMEVLTKMKQMLDAGLITQQQYDAKVAEVMSRM